MDAYLEKLIELVKPPAPRGRPREFTPDDINEIFTLRNAGCIHKEIARRVGCSSSFVGHVLAGKRRFADGLMRNFPTKTPKGK